MRDVVRRAMTKAPATLNALTMADPLGNPKRPIRRRVFVAGALHYSRRRGLLTAKSVTLLELARSC